MGEESKPPVEGQSEKPPLKFGRTLGGSTALSSEKPVTIDSAKVEEQRERVAEAGPGEAFGKHGRLDENDPITTDSQVDALNQGAQQQSKVSQTMSQAIDEMAGISAGLLLPKDPEDGLHEFTSHPIPNYQFGRFHFIDGVLRLNDEDAMELTRQLEKASVQTQSTIKKIDRRAGETIARSFLESRSRMTRGVDTSGDSPIAS